MTDNDTAMTPADAKPAVDYVAAAAVQRTPDYATLRGWVEEVIAAFKTQHDKGFEFTAWTVSIALQNTKGKEGWFIPHNDQRGAVSVRNIVREVMEIPDPACPYAVVVKAAPDGQQAHFYVPEMKLVAGTSVTVTVEDDNGNPQDVVLQASSRADANGVIVWAVNPANGGKPFIFEE